MCSEVARLRHHIELECAAMQQALTGFAITAQHEIIQRKYETLAQYHEQLELLVGEKEAAFITTEIYVKVIG